MNGDHSLAVHALVYLDHRATHLPSQILAENICTNAARVRKVMRPLEHTTIHDITEQIFSERKG